MQGSTAPCWSFSRTRRGKMQHRSLLHTFPSSAQQCFLQHTTGQKGTRAVSFQSYFGQPRVHLGASSQRRMRRWASYHPPSQGFNVLVLDVPLAKGKPDSRSSRDRHVAIHHTQCVLQEVQILDLDVCRSRQVGQRCLPLLMGGVPTFHLNMAFSAGPNHQQPVEMCLFCNLFQ